MWEEDDMSDWLRDAYKKTPNAIKSPLDGCISISNNPKIKMSFKPNNHQPNLYDYIIPLNNTTITKDNTTKK